jgi:glucokinase
MSNTRVYAGLDVGGSTMKAGVVDDEGRPLGPSISLSTEAHRGQEFGLARMCETIQQAVAAAKVGWDRVAAVGVATPGLMDIPAGIILDPPNLKPWQNVPVRQYVHDFFRLPTAFQNDANAAAYGELWAGAGRGARSMVLFTLGTGIGGGIVIGDKVIEGEHSHGAELGHMKIEMTNPRTCGCGRQGCLEAYASALAIVQRAREALAADNRSSLYGRTELTARDIFIAAAAGDALAERRRGDGVLSRHRCHEHDAHDRPRHGRLRRRHDCGRRAVPGAHPASRSPACLPHPRGEDGDPLRQARQRRRLHRRGGVRTAAGQNDDVKLMCRSSVKLSHTARKGLATER